MYCTNCGKPVSEAAVACPSCGVPPRKERHFCYNCGEAVQANQVICTNCGVALAQVSGAKSKVAAGLLAIFLGGLGIHKFYLGYTKEAVIMLLVSIIGGIITVGIASGIVGIIALVEGIIYLTKSDEEFEATYVEGHKGWF